MKKMFVVGVSIIILFSAWVILASASTLEVVEQDPISGVAAQTDGLPAEMQQAVLEAASDSADKKAKADAPVKAMPLPVAVLSVIGESTTYTLGPDDVIEVMVRRHPEFSDKYVINGEGKIQYKFVGDIEVKGMTKTELKEKLTQILGKYIITPEVDVTILEYRSKVIYVIGEVGGPGKYYMKSDKISLREAVVQAGLPTLSAAMRRTVLIRPDKSGKPKQIKVDLYALLYEGKLNLDQDMYPGDVVFVPATLFAKIGRVISPVTQPITQTADTAGRVYYTGGL